MEQKTKVIAEDGKQDLVITRIFDLPVELLFKAHVEPELVEQWMGTKVLKLEPGKHGSYQYETTDPKGNKYEFHGVIHDLIPNQKITRTFEFAKMSLGVQFEIFEFKQLTEDTSELHMHVIYESPAHRAQALKMPFEYGINMAHNQLQNIVGKLK